MTASSFKHPWLRTASVAFGATTALLLTSIAAAPTKSLPDNLGSATVRGAANIHGAAIAADRSLAKTACQTDQSANYIRFVSTATYGLDEMTIKLWPGPKAGTSRFDSARHIYNITDAMWPKLTDCLAAAGVPIRSAEHHTIYWQLHCHLWGSRYSDAFGDTFDMETYRSGNYIPDSDIEKGVFYRQTLCNW